MAGKRIEYPEAAAKAGAETLISGDGDYGKGRRANFVKQSVEKYFRGKRRDDRRRE